MGANTTNQNTQTAPTTIAQNVTRDPYAPAVPFMGDIMSAAQGIYNQGPQPGLTNALNAYAGYSTPGLNTLGPYNYDTSMMQSGGVTPQMQSNISNLNELGMSGGAPFFQPAMQNYENVTSNLAKMASTPDQVNPFLQQLLDANAARIGNEQASLFSGSGRYGSSGMGYGTARAINETNLPILEQAWQQGQQNQLAANQELMGAGQGMGGIASNIEQNRINASDMAAGFYGNAQNAGLQAASQLPGAYQFNYGAGLQPIQQELQAAQYSQQLPWQQLGQYGQIAAGMAPLIGGAGTISTNTQQGPTFSTSQFSQPTPWTTYAGLGLAGAGLLGQFSDARAKTDIQFVGVDPDSGLNMYAFRYIGDPKTYPKVIGPMAQEVAVLYPEKVGRVGDYLYIKSE